MAVQIERATIADLAAIVEIEQATFPDPWSAASFVGLLDTPIVTCLVARDDGAIVGYIVAWVLEGEAEIANLATAPAARRRGIGSALLDSILREADEDGCESVVLEVRESNAAARALYASRGFRAAGRRRAYYRNPTEDAIILRRNEPGSGHAVAC